MFTSSLRIDFHTIEAMNFKAIDFNLAVPFRMNAIFSQMNISISPKLLDYPVIISFEARECLFCVRDLILDPREIKSDVTAKLILKWKNSSERFFLSTFSTIIRTICETHLIIRRGLESTPKYLHEARKNSGFPYNFWASFFS